MSKPWVPDAGDLVWIDLDPQAGHEQAGRRPGLVLSAAAYNGSASLALLCPITKQAKGYPFEVPLSVGTKMTGVVLSDHVKSLDWKARKAEFVAKAPRTVMDTVRQYVALLLGVPSKSS